MATRHFAVRQLPSLLLLLVACSTSQTRANFEALDNLEALANASSAYDSAMSTFLLDLEKWSVHAGRPSSAEALLGPLFLRGGALHMPIKARDTSVVSEYQQLEIRFAGLLARRDSLHRATMTARERVLGWARANGQPAASDTTRFVSPVFPPDIGDSTRAAAKGSRCSAVYISVLPSKEGSRICFLTEESCANDYTFDPPRWMRNCYYDHCFNLIGWVPKQSANLSIRAF